MAPAAPLSANRSEVARAPGRGFQLLTPAFLDELRGRVTLSAIVGRSVPLKRAGNEYKACCPFHQEKTPSFWVNDQKGFYHCFGCGAHGDAIRFLTENQGLAFMDAVKELADQAGLALPEPDRAARERHEQALGLIDVTEAAAGRFEGWLRGAEGAAARAYAAKRGLSEETLKAFRIGFAPDSRTKLRAALPDVAVAQLVESGLLIEVEGKEPYDRFRGRLMVPIRDGRGRVIAFGGRIIGDGEPKYLNSPETPLFDKGRTLFNLDRAAPASRRADRLLVVEGYLDAIALDQAGIREVVAPLGTALTEAQMAKLWTLVDAPILCFDGDKAGQKAAIRAAHRALPILAPGKTLAFALLPEGADPDDIVREGGAPAFEATLKSPVPLAKLIYETERNGIDPSLPEQRAYLRSKLEELAKTCLDRLVAEEFRRTFIDLFYEDFGWKNKERKFGANIVPRTEPRRGAALTYLYQRALLLGLSRHPELLVKRFEELARVSMSDANLRRWQQMLIDAAARRGEMLDRDMIVAICETAPMPGLLRFDSAVDLRFAFTNPDTPHEVAISQLDRLLSLLLEEDEVLAELRELDQRLSVIVGDSDWELMRAERERLHGHLQQLYEREVVWAQSEPGWLGSG